MLIFIWAGDRLCKSVVVEIGHVRWWLHMLLVTKHEREACAVMKHPIPTAPMISLDQLAVGELGRIQYIDKASPMYGRMEDIGIYPGAYIRCERVSLFGDPVAYRLLRRVYDVQNNGGEHNTTTDEGEYNFMDEALVALRRQDARAVCITPIRCKASEDDLPLVAMAGNPNVGKSSLFNTMTGLHQHTGNWTGKTVGSTVGVCRRHEGKKPKKNLFCLADLPGSYSLDPHSPEEDETLQFLLHEPVRAVVVVCEPSNLERNLLIAFQIADLPRRVPVILCINLIDEAERHGITVDGDALAEITGFPVVLTVAKSGRGIRELIDTVSDTIHANEINFNDELLQLHEASTFDIPAAATYHERATRAVCAALHRTDVDGKCPRACRAEHRLDTMLTGRISAIPLAILLLALTFWLTVEGANRPSAWLSALFGFCGQYLAALPLWDVFPWWVEGILLDGVYHTLTWVVAVMLPPMAIFFPLFTLMEDLGLLPRIAFNFDRCFHACNACGKQALTMCMGFGCNAVGVTGCRIIDSPRERMVAMLTNSLVPCNGKFPTIVAMLTVFAVGFQGTTGTAGKYSGLLASLLLTGVVVFCILLILPVSRLLSMTLLRGQPGGFVMEMPPFRVPHVGQVLIRALLDRTLFVLGRAAAVAAPAGAVLWLLTNIRVGGQGLLLHLAGALDPIGVWLCVDGAILVALLLSAPANELTLPVLLMIYSAGNRLTEYSSLGALGAQLTEAGWSTLTLVAFLILFVLHAPCTTTLLTIKKESGKWRWVVVAALIPAIIGICLCLLLRLGSTIF